MRCISANTVAGLCILVSSTLALASPQQAKVTSSYDDVRDQTTVSTPEIEYETYSVRYFYRASYTHPGKKPAPPSPRTVLFRISEVHTDQAAWNRVNRVYFKFGAQRRNYPIARYGAKSSEGGPGARAYYETAYIRIPVGDYKSIVSAKMFVLQIAGKNYIFGGEYVTPLRLLSNAIRWPKQR